MPYCDRCPVSEACLWQGLADEVLAGYRYGIRGGCTAQRRQRIVASLPAGIDYAAAYQAAVDVWVGS